MTNAAKHRALRKRDGTTVGYVHGSAVVDLAGGRTHDFRDGRMYEIGTETVVSPEEVVSGRKMERLYAVQQDWQDLEE